MHADAYFERGCAHRLCQDYACAGASWALVSDGCSSSADSDWGARLLARAAARLLDEHTFSVGLALEAAAASRAALALGPSALDATLLCAWRDDDAMRVAIAGDGFVAARRRDGRIAWWAVRHEDGAPPYPSYLCDAERLGAYLARHGARRIEHGVGDATLAVDDQHLKNAPFVVELALSLADYSLVAVATDGAASFETTQGERVAASIVLEALMSPRSITGAFVLRRCRRFLRDARARGLRHHDDFAFAAVAWP